MHAKAVPSSTLQLEQARTREEPGEVLLTSYQRNSKGDTQRIMTQRTTVVEEISAVTFNKFN